MNKCFDYIGKYRTTGNKLTIERMKILKKNKKLQYGKYKGYEVCYSDGGQIFSRAGWYLIKTLNNKVRDIVYLEKALQIK